MTRTEILLLAGAAAAGIYFWAKEREAQGGITAPAGLRPIPGGGSAPQPQPTPQPQPRPIDYTQLLIQCVEAYNDYALTQRTEYLNTARDLARQLANINQGKDDLVPPSVVDRLVANYSVGFWAYNPGPYGGPAEKKTKVTITHKKSGQTWFSQVGRDGWGNDLSDGIPGLYWAVLDIFGHPAYVAYGSHKSNLKLNPPLSSFITSLDSLAIACAQHKIPVEWTLLPSYTLIPGIVETTGWRGHGYCPVYRSTAPGISGDMAWVREWLKYGYFPASGPGWDYGPHMVIRYKDINEARRILQECDPNKWFYELLKGNYKYIKCGRFTFYCPPAIPELVQMARTDGITLQVVKSWEHDGLKVPANAPAWIRMSPEVQRNLRWAAKMVDYVTNKCLEDKILRYIIYRSG